MLKKLAFLSLFILGLFLPAVINAEPIASVGYIHSEILNQKSVNVPIEPPTTDNNISSSKYLYKQIDVANEILNGYATTDYFNSVEATIIPVVASVAATEIDEKIVQLPYFEFTVQNVDSFDFEISSAGI